MVAGATGYVGLDLIYLLSNHPKVKINYLCAQKSIGKSIKKFDNKIKKKLPKISKLKKVKWNNVDLAFLSLPNREAQKIIMKYKKKSHVKFIDLSADFRIENAKNYKQWYKLNHLKKLIKFSLYAISEFVKKDIKNFRIIANQVVIQLIQLINTINKKKLININNIIITPSLVIQVQEKTLKKFKHKNKYSSIYAYGIFKHRHMSEIDQEFKKASKKKLLIHLTHM